MKLDWLKDIDTSCRCIFAILVLIDKATSEIVKPVVEALCDLDLPLYRQGRQWLLSSRHDPSIRYWSATDMSCLHTADWAAEDRKRFFQVQWSVLAPVIEKQRGYNVYPDVAVLPWIAPRRHRLANREDILKTMISRSHHRFSDSKVSTGLGLSPHKC